MERMTLQDVEALDREYLTPVQVGRLLGSDANSIRLQARLRPDLLRFPAICVGSRVKFPKAAVLAVMRGAEKDRSEEVRHEK